MPPSAIRTPPSAPGLRERPLAEAEGDLDFPALVTFWLTDDDSYERMPPPLTQAQVEAIHG